MILYFNIINTENMQWGVLIAFFLCISGIASTNVTVAIIGTNDIHGSALPTIMQRQDTG